MAVEAALVLPVAMLFVGLVIVMAGQALAQQAVTAAATRAARVASLESSQASARNAAVAELGSSHITCTDTQVAVDARGLASPPGTVASVTVRIVCQANFPVSLPGFPAHRSLVGEGVSPVDTYRGRDG